MAPVSSSDSMAIRLLVICFVFPSLATVAVFGRFWARHIKNTHLKANDYLVLVALLFTWGFNIAVMLAVFNGGAGQHNTNVSEEELVVLAKAFVAAGALYGVAVAMVKLSVLDFYTNMFRGKVFKIVTYTFTALVICHGIIVILATLLICRPLAKNWYPALEGSCGDTETLYLAIGIANLALDIAVVVLPMPLLWSLQMRTSKKIALTFIFGLGAFVCIVSILRIVSIHNLDPKNLSYTSAADGIWSSLEPDLGIISACLPIMQPLLSRIRSITTGLSSLLKNTSHISLRHKSLRLPDNDSATKRPNDEHYPLSNIVEANKKAGTSYNRFHEDIETLSLNADTDMNRSINVKKEFSVVSAKKA